LIRFKQKGDFKNLESFLNRAGKFDMRTFLDRYGREGVEALRSNTPIDSGLTASSWDYYIETNKRTSKIVWTNTHNISGVNIAIILQYGHATKNGGYVQGQDYINPAIRPIMDKIAEDVWREVCRL
jgi:hypothetical protein